MSSFVLSNKETFENIYQKDHYKYLHLTDPLDPVGYAKIIVLVHEDDCMSDDELFKLQEYMELLHDYGYLHVEYIDGSGFHFKRPYEPPATLVSTQEDMLSQNPTGLSSRAFELDSGVDPYAA